MLSRHFHPSVVTFTTALLNATPISYAGDPLTDFTTMNFLDKFVFKNPKQHKEGEDKNAHGRRLSRKPSAFMSSIHPTVYNEQKAVADHEYFFKVYFDARRKKQAAENKLQKLQNKNEAGEDLDSEEAMDRFADELMEREMIRMGANPDEDEAEDELAGLSDASEDEGDEEGEVNENDFVMMDGLDEEALQNAMAAADGGMYEEDDEAGEEEMPEEDGSDADEDAALEEAFGADGGAGAEDDDSEVEMDSLDEESLDEEGEMDFLNEEDELSDEAVTTKLKGKKGSKGSDSVFASAEEFADILATSGESGVHRKQEQWEDRSSR